MWYTSMKTLWYVCLLLHHPKHFSGCLRYFSTIMQDIMTNDTYKKLFSLGVHSSRGLESIIITIADMAVDMQIWCQTSS